MKSCEVRWVSKVSRSVAEAEREPRLFGPDASGSTLYHCSHGAASPQASQKENSDWAQTIIYTTVSYTPAWHLPRLLKVNRTASQRAAHISWGRCILHSTCGLGGGREFSYLLSFIHRGLQLPLTHMWQLFCVLQSHPKHFSYIGHVNVLCLPTSLEPTVIIFCVTDKKPPLLS